MFEGIIRELERLGSQKHKVAVSISLDGKCYYDRECPNAECEAAFKVLFEDWRDKVADERVFCPFCRYEATSDRWHTPEQVKHIRSAGLAEGSRLLEGAFEQGVAESRPMRMGGGLVSATMSLAYRPGRIPAVVPAAATAELRQEFACQVCGCRYASLGASFFCPACGHNSATSSFDNTLDTVRKTLLALEPMRQLLADDPDAARDATRQILEDQFARLVGAFERVNEALFDELRAAAQIPRRGSVFQRIDDASALWQQAAGKGYGHFLSPSELARLKLLFHRRHILSHRQGMVDEKYISNSGDTGYTIGQRLVATEADVFELIDLLAKLTSGLRTLVP